MSCSFDAYLLAVAKRKAIKDHGVNFAIATELEQKDIPILLEIIRVQKKALDHIMDLTEDFDEHEVLGEVAQHCAVAHLDCDKLAAQGSTARWGEYEEEKGNGHNTAT